jgi:hypothetical protein
MTDRDMADTLPPGKKKLLIGEFFMLASGKPGVEDSRVDA